MRVESALWMPYLAGLGKNWLKEQAFKTHICTNCGYVADRDEMASRNILLLGLDKATGEGISIESPMNQEPHTL